MKSPFVYSLLALLLALFSGALNSLFPWILMILLSIGIAFWSINANDRRQKQRQRKQSSIANIIALFAIILAVLSGINGPLAPRIREAQVRKQLIVERKNLHEIGQALESYHGNAGTYPVDLMPYLTTPIIYLPSIPVDGFLEKEHSYSYWHTDNDWLVIGVGPDRTLSTDWNMDTIPDALTILHLSYDPTNGIESEGDIILNKVEFQKQNRPD